MSQGGRDLKQEEVCVYVGICVYMYMCVHVCMCVYVVVCVLSQSCLTLCNPMDCRPPGSSVHGNSSSKNTGVGCHALLQGIFPTQGSNPGLLHCWWILYHLSHQGSLYMWLCIYIFVCICECMCLEQWFLLFQESQMPLTFDKSLDP